MKLYAIFVPTLLLAHFVLLSNCQTSPVLEFTSCGATGRKGPTQDQCDAQYGSFLTNMFSIVIVNGIQHITIPFPGIFRFQAYGAGGVGENGGTGAFVSGEFALPQGASIKILVGQQGEMDEITNSFGGAGGSFVARSGSTEPMLVAGGGTSSSSTSSNMNDASVSNDGNDASDSSDVQGKGGTSGDGGTSGLNNAGGGGAGFKTAGNFISGSQTNIIQAQPFLLPSTFSKLLSAGFGGTIENEPAPTFAGGFGGGGYAFQGAAGGGGGYSGGGGAAGGVTPGGGGSYNSGMNQENDVTNTGQGKVTFQFIGKGIETICTEHSFTTYFFRELVYGETDFVLNNSTCKSTSNDTHVIITSRLDACGTTVSLNNKTVNFTNIIRSSDATSNETIQRHKFNDIPVTCSYSVSDAASLDIFPDLAVIQFLPELEEGEFLVSLYAYNSTDYSYKYKQTDFPLTISTDDNLFLEVGLAVNENVEGLELMLDNCFASPSSNKSEETISKYQMIEDGCIVDSTLQYLPSANDVTRRFFFKVFDFSSANVTSVFIHCEALLCNSSDTTSRCKQGCQRHKRSTSHSIVNVIESKRTETTDSGNSSYNGVIRDEKVVGSIGPFLVKDEESENENAENSDFYIIIASSVAAVLFVLMIPLIAYVIYMKVGAKAVTSLSSSTDVPQLSEL